jgi:formylglycine-generating enzyme required for sulfatase activity
LGEHKFEWRFLLQETMTFQRVLLAIFLSFGLVAVSFAQPKENRVALIVGNSAYKSAPLRNPINDAKDIAAKLKGMGFTVIERSNLSVKQIGSTLREFRSKLTPGSVALVFYAGHGVQIKGENYLPAVDADISSEEDVPTQSLAMRQIMDVLGDAKTRLNLVFLDACRNNPYARSFRSASDGLNRVNAPSGTLISFATRPGSVASDGNGRNGLYTSALLEQMNNQNQPIEQILKRVVSQVKASSSSQQEPWMEGSIEGEFCFGECGKPVAQSGTSDDRVFWESVKDSRDVNEIKAYLEQFPRGIFAGIARARVNAFDKTQPQVEVARPPQVPAAASTPDPTAVSAGIDFKDCSDCPELVSISGGEFEMGSNDDYDSSPMHRVNVQGFLIGKSEVTQAQWRTIMGNEPSFFSQCGDNCPVEQVSWNEAQEFIRRLSQKTGKRYRLPSEAEWEYAARGGSSNKWSFGNSDFQLDEHAWFVGNSANRTHPVWEKRPNAFGLHGVFGNVWEWTQDCWSLNYSGAPTDGAARTQGDCARRVLRGGAWSSPAQILYPSFRNFGSVGVRLSVNGFRVARSP